MIGCYEIQGCPAIHSWTPSSRPISLDHQQGVTHHAKCLLLILEMSL